MKTVENKVRHLVSLAVFLVTLLGTMSATVQAREWIASTDADLRQVIPVLQNGDTINFVANITLTGDLPVVQKNVSIFGNNFSLSGNNQFRGLFIGAWVPGTATQAPVTVTIQDLIIIEASARGGAGGNGYFAGGGGAGLGGALFVANLANVTVSNVLLLSNSAIGGNGGIPAGYFGGGGGGGMGGRGGVVVVDDTAAGGGGLGVGADGGGGGGGVARPTRHCNRGCTRREQRDVWRRRWRRRRRRRRPLP